MLSLIYSGRGKKRRDLTLARICNKRHPMSPFTLQSCSTPAPSALAYCSMLRDISRTSLDSSSATYTAPFLNPLTTAKAALYFSCCRRWLTVYRMVFTSSGPAMVRSAVPDTTLMSVAHTHTYRSGVSHWIRAVLTSKSGSYVSLALVRVFEMKCISFLFVCLKYIVNDFKPKQAHSP